MLTNIHRTDSIEQDFTFQKETLSFESQLQKLEEKFTHLLLPLIMLWPSYHVDGESNQHDMRIRLRSRRR